MGTVRIAHENLISFVAEQRGALRKLLKRRGSKKLSTKRVHDIRVAVRRLRVAIWISKREPESPGFRALSHKLRELGNIFGKLRQVDVAIGDARSYRLPGAHLKSMRKKARDAVDECISRSPGELIDDEAERLLRRLKNGRGKEIEAAAYELLRMARAMNGSLPKNKREFHQFRIFVKKVRYAMEAFGYRPGPVKLLHDRLGKAHDLEVLQQLVGKKRAVRLDEAMHLKESAKMVKPIMLFAINRLAAVARAAKGRPKPGI
jgi:CHAD domain-containing protein